VLYLDEPTVGIDARSRRTILDAIAALKREGVTIIYTSHYMEEVEALCDAVAIIDQGRLLACGSIDDVLRAHGRSTFEVTFASSPPDEVRAALAGLGGAWRDGLNLTLAVTEPAALNRALEALTQSRAQIAHLQYGVARLEQAYLALLSHAETP
jgi:ABC-2 type transport system ATP-binding protein